MSSISALRTLSHQGQKSDLIELENTDRASCSSSQMIHRDIVSTPGCISAASTAPTTHFTSPIASPLHVLGPAPSGPPSVELEAQLQEYRAQLIQIIRRQLANEERVHREVAAILVISAARIEADQNRIDWIHRHITELKQDMELWEREGFDTDLGERREIQYFLDMLRHLEERLALNRQRRDHEIARMAPVRVRIERLRQVLRCEQGGAVDEEETHEAVVLNEQFQDFPATGGDIQNQVEEGPAGELAPPVLMSMEETINEPALNSPEHQISAMESLDHLGTNSPAAALPILEVQHIPISPTAAAPIVNQPTATQGQPTVNNGEIGEPTPIKKPKLSHELTSISQLGGAGNIGVGKRKRDEHDEEVEGQFENNVPNGWGTRLRKRSKTDHS